MRPIRWLRRPSTTAPMTNAGEIAGTLVIVAGAQAWITDGVAWGLVVWFVGGIIARAVDRRAVRPPVIDATMRAAVERAADAHREYIASMSDDERGRYLDAMTHINHLLLGENGDNK